MVSIILWSLSLLLSIFGMGYFLGNINQLNKQIERVNKKIKRIDDIMEKSKNIGKCHPELHIVE